MNKRQVCTPVRQVCSLKPHALAVLVVLAVLAAASGWAGCSRSGPADPPPPPRVDTPQKNFPYLNATEKAPIVGTRGVKVHTLTPVNPGVK